MNKEDLKNTNMEYTSLFEPLLCIFLSLMLGILIGVISMLWISAKDLKATNEELEKRFKRIDWKAFGK